MSLSLVFKPFSFRLNCPLRTSKGVIQERNGLILRLRDQDGGCGWGEVAPFDNKDLKLCTEFLARLGDAPKRNELEKQLNSCSGALAFGLGAALAELDGQLRIHLEEGDRLLPSAVLLPNSEEELFAVVDELILQSKDALHPLTLKWKVALLPDCQEQSILRKISERLPLTARLRLDANGGWDRFSAQRWAEYLVDESRLEWLEQPLAAEDIEGLWNLAKLIPVALDESLLFEPSLRVSWPGWQVRRPILDGDPRQLLRELEDGVANRMISTAFETGIGRRWVKYLAALQQKGPTPVAPGLAPEWTPDGPLFSLDPECVWRAL